MSRVRSVRALCGQYAYAVLDLDGGGQCDIRLEPGRPVSKALAEHADRLEQEAAGLLDRAALARDAAETWAMDQSITKAVTLSGAELMTEARGMPLPQLRRMHGRLTEAGRLFDARNLAVLIRRRVGGV